jgi:hypothetical protein
LTALENGDAGTASWRSKTATRNEPPGYRRARQRSKPKFDAFLPLIRQRLEDDGKAPPKQKHIARRIPERLGDEDGSTGGTQDDEIPSGDELSRVIDVAKGLTRSEAENAYSLSLNEARAVTEAGEEGLRSRSSAWGLWATGRRRRSSGPARLTDCGTSLPEQDAMAGDPGNPRRFPRSTKWKKVMDEFFHGQLTDCG